SILKAESSIAWKKIEEAFRSFCLRRITSINKESFNHFQVLFGFWCKSRTYMQGPHILSSRFNDHVCFADALPDTRAGNTVKGVIGFIPSPALVTPNDAYDRDS